MREVVIKHKAAIEIAGSISGTQRKIWNVLLGYAYSDLLTQEEHSISLRLLAIMLDYPRSSYERLKEDLQTLVDTVVEWNILSDDQEQSKEWTVCSMLSGITIIDGMVNYSYYPRLRRLLYHPKQFARVNLLQQLKIRSKYALILYELCEYYLDAGITPQISLERYRAMMGVGVMDWRDVQRRLIQEPLEQVNSSTAFSMVVETIKEGKKIRYLQFSVRKK